MLDSVGDFPNTTREKEARTMAHQRNIKKRERKPRESTKITAAAPYRERGPATPRVDHHSTTVRTTAQQHASQPNLLKALGLSCRKISDNGENSRSSPEYSFPNENGMRLQSSRIGLGADTTHHRQLQQQPRRRAGCCPSRLNRHSLRGYARRGAAAKHDHLFSTCTGRT